MQSSWFSLSVAVCEMKLYSVVTVLCNLQGGCERVDLKAAVLLSIVAALLSRTATYVNMDEGGKINVRENFVEDLEWSAIRTVAGSREHALPLL